MSDLGIWRIGFDDVECFVVRIHGSEHMLTEKEFKELDNHLFQIVSGAQKSLGEEYIALSNRRKAPVNLSGILSGLGIAKPKLRRI
jgi:hypothetical protein